jgi:hypothetical protein
VRCYAVFNVKPASCWTRLPESPTFGKFRRRPAKIVGQSSNQAGCSNRVPADKIAHHLVLLEDLSPGRARYVMSWLKALTEFDELVVVAPLATVIRSGYC